MSINVKVLGCNGLCGSCYENSIREKSHNHKYDIEKILAVLKDEVGKIPKDELPNRHPPCVHGGEPLLMRVPDLEQIFAFSFETFGRSSIQTNGLLVQDKHIELFKKYKTHVGFSLDGDTAELNFGRWNATTTTTLKEIEAGTQLVLDNIKQCKSEGLPVSVITVLRSYNASYGQLPALKKFLLRLHEEYGCSAVRTNEVIVYDPARRSEQLTPTELGRAYMYLADVCFENPRLTWSPYRDIVDLLLGYKEQTCIFMECDPWKTSSETTINENGDIGNCLKTGGAPDGLSMLAADSFSRERYAALAQIPQEHGGCKDCKFWNICKGGCPGAGIDNDWRNRTRFCEGWKMLYEHIAMRLNGLLPNLYLSPLLPKQLMDPTVTLVNFNPKGSSWKAEKRIPVKKVLEERAKRKQCNS